MLCAGGEKVGGGGGSLEGISVYSLFFYNLYVMLVVGCCE